MPKIPPASLQLEDAADYVGLSVATVEGLRRDNDFPKPRALSKRRAGYLVRELDEWLESRPVADMAPPPNTGHGNRIRGKRAPRGEPTTA